MPNVVYNCCYIFGDSDFFWSQIGFSTCSISIYILAMCLALDIHLLWLVILRKYTIQYHIFSILMSQDIDDMVKRVPYTL
jgi:hypothetical protein